MQINLNSLLLIYVSALNLLIGTYVYRRNTNAGPNRAFGFLALTTALWTAGLVLSHHTNDPRVVYLGLAFSAGSLVPLGTLAFIETFASPLGTQKCFSITVCAPIALAFCLASFSPLIVVAVSRDSDGLRVLYGPLHPFLVVYVVGCFAYSIWILARKHRAATGSLKLQTRYLLLAFAIPVTLGTLTNVIVPSVLKTSTLGKYGPLFTLLMIAMIGHAIIRHRLMDIRIVIKRSAAYLASFVVAGLILMALLVGSNALFQDEHQVPVREILLALVVAVLFQPLKVRIQRAFDRYLYREPYDYQRTIREVSRALARTLDLTTLLAYVGGVLSQTLRPEGSAIYLKDHDLRNGDEGQFQRAFPDDHTPFPDEIPPSSPLLGMVLRERRSIFRDELGRDRSVPQEGPVLAEMKCVGAEVLVPLIEEDQVIGFLALGPKRSGDPYFSDDADLLTTLANQSAVAIHNAQAHQRVVLVNEEIQKILATIESGVIAVGAKGRITMFNRAAEQMTALSPHALRGQPLQHLPAPLARLIEGTVEDGQSRLQMELALPDAAGQLVPVVCSTSPLRGSQGAIVGAVAVFSDLSRLKELEAEKRRAERLASLEAIASGIVHEIKNPLVAIKTFSQLLPVRYEDESFRESFSRVATREIGRIDELLERFRTLAAASSQPMEPIDVSDPLRATLEALQPQIEERQIRLRQVGDGIPRSIFGNSSQLQQLFHNLCLNAIEAMEPGGELTVRVADLSEAGGSLLLVEVSDTGCGIPEDLLATIFDPFVSTKARGTGLGLAICRGIVDAHRATLRARNNAGRAGSTFTVEFPVLAERKAGATP